MMNNADDGGKRVKAVQRAFTVIHTLQESGTMRIADVAEELDIPNSTAHVHLKTLESVGYAVKDDGGYRLSLRFLRDGTTIQGRQKIYQAAKPEIDELAAETGEVANLGVEENGLRVILYQSEGSEAIYDNASVGEHTNMHWTALGKAILGEQSPEYIDTVIEAHGLPVKTKNTISERSELLSAIETIEEQGYALEDEERREGIRSVSLPIIVENSLVGAISLSGPKERFSDQRIEENLVPELRNTTNVIEVKYAYD